MNVEVKNYIDESVVEELYADTDTISAGTTSPAKVEEGKIRDGYDAVIVSAAVTNDSDCYLYIKRNGKQVYDNGLNCAGLAAGQYLNNEVLLGVPLKEGDSWELGFTNTSGSDKTINWRLRIRLFRRR
ncbi:MAG: hypothetical protein JRD89_18420 [Deltaproteobacteria bacterium]|nr:hypothetical protein [Deltaproteobacteria bacterium]